MPVTPVAGPGAAGGPGWAWAPVPSPVPAPAPPSGGSAGKWLGWFVALALGALVIVLVAVNRAGDSDSDSDSDSSGGGPFHSTAPVPITDNSTAESTIDVTGVDGNAPRSLGIAVDIDHSHLGDLDMELIAPDGTTFDLDPHEGPHEYTIDASAAPAGGTWTLRIEDSAAVDEGTLNSWSLLFGPGQASRPGSSGGGSFDSTAPVPIEDRSTAESTIDVTGIDGNAPRSLGIAVDIDHSHLGDLDIELIAPDGTTFDLDPHEGPHEYTIDASGARAGGTWTLRIEDTLSSDDGTLNSWSLRF